jgi:ADP-ribose pyrophosphatase
VAKRLIVERRARILDDFFKVDEAFVRFEQRDGKLSPTVRRLNFERGDSAAVIIFDASVKKVILVNQFKYPTAEKGPGWITETAAGIIDPGETPEAAAHREVLEEVGYAASKLVHIATFYVSPGGSSERVSLFYARVETREKTGEGGGLAKENEDIETIEVDIDEAMTEVSSGIIVDAKTIIAILWLKDYLARHPEG